MSLVACHDPVHHLIQAEVTGIQLHRVLGLAEGRGGPGAVGQVTTLEVRQHRIEIRCLALGLELQEAPSGAVFMASGLAPMRLGAS